MSAESPSTWPKQAFTAGNAGVFLVGRSDQHGSVPAALLGGRFYTGKKVYRYTDFGGGVERAVGETPQQGAFREFAEELLGQDEQEAKVTAKKLCTATSSALIGGRPFIHKSYVIFIISADKIVEALRLPGARGVSALDLLFSSAKRNSELSSVALVSIEALLQAPFEEGRVRTLSVRQLDGEARPSDQIWLRELLVQKGGSLFTISDALESFANQVFQECRRNLNQNVGASELQQLPNPPEDHGAAYAPEQIDLMNPETLRGDKASCSLTRRLVSVQHDHVLDSGRGDNIQDHNMQDDAEKGTNEAKETNRRWGRAAAKLSSTKASVESSIARPSAVACQTPASTKAPYVFDMETGDPDDLLTLLFLCSNADVELRAVTITPGSEEQVSLVRWILEQMNMTHIRLGAQDWPVNSGKKANLNTQFYKSFGRSPRGEPPCERADQVLAECCDESVTLLTGAPLHNLGAALRIGGFQLGRWVAQGGFAGEGVVPREKQMDKFKGQEMCRTWNFGGSVQAAQDALASACIFRKICVSKNVCHSVYYDEAWHLALGEAADALATESPQTRRASAFRMMYNTMDGYLKRKPEGKKLHDPLALAVALNESVCELAEVKLFCRKGEWGSRLSPGSNVWISVDYDPAKFQSVMLH